MRRAGGVSLALALFTLACDTRVVQLQLQPPSDPAAPGQSNSCSEFTREDGARCQLCFDGDASVTSTRCSGAPDAAAMPGNDTCKVIRPGADRCFLCGTGGNVCLKCDARQPSVSGGTCRVCVWSDDPMQRCLQCFADDGSTREDNCNGLRKETLLDATTGDGGA